MIQLAIPISLKILAIYVVLSEGYALHFVKCAIQDLFYWFLGYKVGAVITAPLFNCYVCMSSFWTIVIGLIMGLSWMVIFDVMFLVLAFNFIIATFYEVLTGEDL